MLSGLAHVLTPLDTFSASSSWVFSCQRFLILSCVFSLSVDLGVGVGFIQLTRAFSTVWVFFFKPHASYKFSSQSETGL